MDVGQSGVILNMAEYGYLAGQLDGAGELRLFLKYTQMYWEHNQLFVGVEDMIIL